MLDKIISLLIGIFLGIIIMYFYNLFFMEKPDFQNSRPRFENMTGSGGYNNGSGSGSLRGERIKKSQNLDSN